MSVAKSIHPNARGPLRLDRAIQIIDQRLESEPLILDALIASAVRGQPQRQAWDNLHLAAARDGRVGELSAAYEQLLHGTRLKLLSAPVLAEVLTRAGAFFEDVAANLGRAVELLHRALSAAPTHAEAFTRLEALLGAQKDTVALIELYVSTGSHCPGLQEQLSYLRRAADLASSLPDDSEEAIKVYQQIIRLDPGDHASARALEDRFVGAGRPRDAAKLLEQIVGGHSALPVEEDTAIRERLLALYTDLQERERTISHVEKLLAQEPSHFAAQDAAESLLGHRALASRAAAALADAFDRQGDFARASSILEQQLAHTRGSKRVELLRRLAVLRHDKLKDVDGSHALLEELVSADVTDDDVRRRYQQVSAALSRGAYAVRILTNAVAGVKNAAARIRIQSELGQFAIKSGDLAGAREAFEQVIAAGGDDQAVLVAAREMAKIYGSEQPLQLAGALEIVVRLESDDAARWAATEQLATLYQNELADPAKAVAAWSGLLDSPLRERATDALEGLYGSSRDDEQLATILDLRASRESDRDKARALATRAAVIRAGRTSGASESVAIWRELLRNYGPSREAHGHILPLLEKQQSWAEVADTLRREIELTPREEHAPLFARMGQICLMHLKDVRSALEAYRGSLAVDPGHAASRRAVEGLLKVQEAALTAAELLEPIYRSEQNWAGLLAVLEARAKATTVLGPRLATLEEMTVILAQNVGDPMRALRVATEALRLCVSHAPDQIQPWLVRLDQLSPKGIAPAALAALLTRALGNHPVDSLPVLLLATRAADALLASGDAARALALYRAAVEHDPGNTELVRRVEGLVMQQGSPEERIAVHRASIERCKNAAQRRESLDAIALIQSQELGDLAGAVATLRTALSDSPTDVAVQDALFDSLTKLGDQRAIYEELERCLANAQGERRTSLLLKAADVASRDGRVDAAIAHCHELLSSSRLSEESLETIERIAEASNSPETMRDVLQRRILGATDPRLEVAWLEKLGSLQHTRLGDASGALGSWKRAAALAVDIPEDPEVLRRFYRHILAVNPADRETADRLIELCQKAEEWDQVFAIHESLLQHVDDEAEAVGIVLGMETAAVRGQAGERFASAADYALKRFVRGVAKRVEQLVAAKARVVASDPARADEAARLLRGLVASAEDPEPFTQAFEGFLAKSEPTEGRRHDEQWLSAWRNHAIGELDRTGSLIAAARAEESIANLPAAVEAYRRVLEYDSDCIPARFACVRLWLALGDAERALAALSDLRERTRGSVRAGVELRMGRLLAEDLDRPGEAMAVVASVLEATPADPTALPILHRALGRPSTRPSAAALLERASKSASTKERAAGILQVLLDAPADTTELSQGRQGWYERLLDLSSSRPDDALVVALRATAEFPETRVFWDSAERFARSVQRPEPVIEAYRNLLERTLAPEMAEWVGRRAVDFYEEWSEDTKGTIALLERIHALHGGSWAFDRLKLAFSAEGQYDALFALYERAIEQAPESARAEILEEAAEAARNFARDPERAILYLERLAAIRQGDVSALSALERLYEKQGHNRRLIALLRARLEGMDEGEAAQALRGRMAGLFLDMLNQVKALELVEQMLEKDAASGEAFELLRRILLPEDRPDPVAAPSETSPEPLSPHLVERAASRLKRRYLMEDKTADVIRIIDVELRAADSDAERTVLHQQRAKLHREELGDYGQAFDSYIALVALEPQVEEHRANLRDLADRLDRHARLADALVAAADSAKDPDLKAELNVEAAGVYRDHMNDPGRAITLLSGVVGSTEVSADMVLRTACALEPLLASQHLAGERCAVLEKIAALETDADARRKALGEAARISSDVLADLDRAARAWRSRLEIDPKDREALDGLIVVLESARQWRPLIAALEARAAIAERDIGRKDLGRIATIYADELAEVGQAILAWNDVRKTFGPDRESLHKLSSLLESHGKHEELAALLQEEVESEAEPTSRVALLARLGDICRDRLGDVDRAAKSYGEALLADPGDASARRGLSQLQGRAEVRRIAQDALARAYVKTQEWETAAALAIKLAANEDVPSDIGRAFWWGVGKYEASVRKDADAAEAALRRAIGYDEASVEILEALANLQSRNPNRVYVTTMMRLSDVKGGDLRILREAAEVAVLDREEPRIAPLVCSKVLDCALAQWTGTEKGSSARSAQAAAEWALDQLIVLAHESNDVARAIELLKKGAGLPFERSERRRMNRKAADLSAEKLGDAQAALSVYREIFAEDSSDAVAEASTPAFAGLLERQGLFGELAALWERQAAHSASSEPIRAAELWERAAKLADERLGDEERAIADHKKGAELGGLGSLEMLAGLYEQRGAHEQAAAMLERICELGPRERLVANTLRLVDAYAAAGSKGAARARLEHAIELLADADALSDRLADLYREEEAWDVLADFLASQASRIKDAGKRLSLLTQAIEIQSTKLHSTKGAIPLLEQVVELAPDNVQPRLVLAEAFIETRRPAQAIRVLDAQIARYGSRKPKERALVHHSLARALVSSDKKRAMAELEQAARIDPAHAGILYMLARLALEEGELDLADHTYQALLMLHRSAREEVDGLVSRAQLFAELADIAEKRGDVDRAADLRASAAEALRASEGHR